MDPFSILARLGQIAVSPNGTKVSISVFSMTLQTPQFLQGMFRNMSGDKRDDLRHIVPVLKIAADEYKPRTDDLGFLYRMARIGLEHLREVYGTKHIIDHTITLSQLILTNALEENRKYRKEDNHRSPAIQSKRTPDFGPVRNAILSSGKENKFEYNPDLNVEPHNLPLRDLVSKKLWREEEKKIIIDLLRALKVKVEDTTMEDTGMLEAYDRILGGKEREFTRKINNKIKEIESAKEKNENEENEARVSKESNKEDKELDDISEASSSSGEESDSEGSDNDTINRQNSGVSVNTIKSDITQYSEDKNTISFNKAKNN